MLYPNDDLVLPSLWEALTGRQDVDWAEREDGGRFVDFTPDFARVWQWKDELPEQRLVCAGKHLGGKASLVSLRLLPSLYALTGRAGSAEDFREEELSPVERDVAEAVLESGPISTAELPELAGHERKRVGAATHRLQRRLVLTAAGRQERERAGRQSSSICFRADTGTGCTTCRHPRTPAPDWPRWCSVRRRSSRRPTSQRSSADRVAMRQPHWTGSSRRERRALAMEAASCSGLPPKRGRPVA